MTDLAAIILTGGRGERLGDVEKALIEHDGARLIDHAIAGARSVGAERIVVVGDTPVPADVLVVREDPPFGGPLAALDAGLAALGTGDAPADPEWILLLAGDLPYVRDVCAVLADARNDALEGGDPVEGVCLIDDAGYRQHLAGCYRVDALRANLSQLTGGTSGLPLKVAFTGMWIAMIPDPRGITRDIDTPDDLRATGARLPE